MHMKVIELAYQGKVKQQTIQNLKESNERLTYDILMQKSANHVGSLVLNETSPMKFVEQGNVIQLTTPDSLLIDDEMENVEASKPIIGLLQSQAFAQDATQQ